MLWDRIGKSTLVVSLGTWFGAAVFFNFLAAPAIFDSFKEVVKSAPSDRTAYLPLAADETEERKAQLANALAGAAVGPLFPRFFALQALCGTLALIVALGWWNAGETVHRWRVLVLALALLTVAVGWPISLWVSDLRLERWAPGAAVNDKVQSAFRNAHVISLLLSVVTALLAFAALVLSARMPAEPTRSPPPTSGPGG